jgi:nicotinamide mononucleotide (NMN) deamidase PncC
MSQRAEILHRSPWQGVFYVTGGGTLLLSEMLTTPGASATVLEARVPYGEAAMKEILGRTPEQACSDSTARALAMAAFQHARRLTAGHNAAQPSGVPSTSLFGLACTASLATNRRKRGQHRAHVAVQTEAATYGARFTFDAEREAEEAQLLELLWHTLAEALPLTEALPVELPGTPPAQPVVAHTPAQQHWRELILAETLAYVTAPHEGELLMPGAFNPLHHAHERMLEIAEQKTGLAGAYELSIVNVDKPLLDYTEIDTRLRQFTRPVWVTRLPTFIEKARHFRGAHFVVGIDTLMRIAEPGYYHSPESSPEASLAARDRALTELAEHKARFVVFGRTLDKQFVCLSDLDLPSPLRDLCIEVTEAEFHEPVSSTELRRVSSPEQHR